MTDMGWLDKMIKSSAKVRLENHRSRDNKITKKVTLRESTEKGEYKVVILNVPGDAIVISIDDKFDNGRLFSGANDECKRGDYIIVSEEERLVVFIEMKLGSASKSEIINQLRGSRCVLEYCQSLAQEFYGRKKFLSGYKHRFIGFVQIRSSRKKGKKNGRDDDGRDVWRPMRISGKSLVQFRTIAAS